MQELDSIEILFADYTEDDFDRLITYAQESNYEEPYPSDEPSTPPSPANIPTLPIRYNVPSKDRFIHPPPADRLIQEVESIVRGGPPSKKQKSLLSLVALKEEMDDLRTQLELSHEMLMNLIVLNNKNS